MLDWLNGTFGNLISIKSAISIFAPIRSASLNGIFSISSLVFSRILATLSDWLLLLLLPLALLSFRWTRIYDIEKVEESNQIPRQWDLLFLISRGQLPGVQKFRIHRPRFFSNAFLLLKLHWFCHSPNDFNEIFTTPDRNTANVVILIAIIAVLIIYLFH